MNNFVLVQFLGLCPFMGVSNKLETAMGMSLATTFVLRPSSVLSYLTYHLHTGAAGRGLPAHHFDHRDCRYRAVHRDGDAQTSPLLYRVLGIFLPLIHHQLCGTGCGPADGQERR
ncbi:MAG: Rnf-Nqr domain containing protein [Gammaproteobacteria bacterium]